MDGASRGRQRDADRVCLHGGGVDGQGMTMF
jgi:hypothetical protein